MSVSVRQALALCGLLLSTLAVAQGQGASSAAASASAPVAPTYHFRAPAAGAVAGVSRSVLSDEDRAFIATLPEVRVGMATPAFRPYEVIGEDGEISGVHPEMLVALARAFGIRLRPVVFASFAQALEAAQRRDVDLLMSMGVNSARAEYLEFTLGATPMVSAIFTRSGPPPPPPAQARFALVRNNLANDFVARVYPAARIQPVGDVFEAMTLVAAAQADYYVGNLLPALDRLQRDPVPGIQVQELVNYGSGHYHFAVRKDWAPLARILNKGISSVRGQPSAQLAAAMASVPGGGVAPAAKALTPVQTAVLIERPVWRVGAVRGLALLNDVDDKGKHGGIAAEYTEVVARTFGVGVQIVPFADVGGMLDALRTGVLDVVPFLTRTDERAAEFAYSAPYVEMPYVIVARVDAPLYWGLDSLRGKRLALAAQHPLRALLSRRYQDIEIVDVAGGSGAMDAVATGAADAAIEVKFFANLRIVGDSRLRTVAAVDELPAQFHFATSTQARALVPLINEALADIPEAERLRMLRRWVAQDVTPAFPWRRHAPALAVGAGALLALALATLWWMRRLQREVRARRASEELLREVGAALPCVAFRSVFDDQGAQISSYYSEGAEAFLGFALDPALTLLQNIGPRLRPEERVMAEALQRASLQSGERIKITGQYQHPDGRLRWLHCEAVAQRGSDGLSRLTGCVVDVSTERRLQAKLVQAERARHLMLASASHELRAPAHTLSLALQSMALAAGARQVSADAMPADAVSASTPGPLAGPAPAMADSLQVARDAARTLTQLLNDVLDTARLDHGELALRPQAFALRGFIDELQQSTRTWAADKGLACEFETAAEVPTVVVLDPMRLRQVATNLLSNAIKYTAQGRVSLQVRLEAMPAVQPGQNLEASSAPQPWPNLEARSAPQPWLCLRVSDTGAGIAVDRLANVFTPYVAADGAAAPAEGSTGLGLSVCRRLVTQMGGLIELHSQPGQGTQVEVRLPLPPPRPALPIGPVLVCDDDDISRTLLAQMLMLQGFEVIEARDGTEALQRWRQGDVRALITDLDMPGVSGLQLIERVRAEQGQAGAGAADTRVLVCSGSLVPEAALGAKPPQHDAYLAKPVDMAVLVETLLAVGVRPGHSSTHTTSK